MRLSLSLVAILAITLIYVSCNNHTLQKSIVTPNKILSGWASSTNPELRTQFTFDGSHKVIREETDHDISSYYFINDSVVVKEFNKEENRYVYEFKGRLNGQKVLVDGIATSSYIPNTPDTVHHLFKYDLEGYLLSETRISSLSDTFLVKYEYEDNLVNKVSTYTNNILYNVKEFKYYNNDLSYNLPEEIKFRKNINDLVGRSQPNLVKEVISTGRHGRQKYILKYEYEIDENRYASRMIIRKGKRVCGITTFDYQPRLNYSGRSLAIK